MTWMMSGEIEIEANDIGEAMTKAIDENLPEGEYISDSIRVQVQTVKELNGDIPESQIDNAVNEIKDNEAAWWLED
jgi:hypothetical protein